MKEKESLKTFQKVMDCSDKTTHYSSHMGKQSLHNVEVKDDLSCFQLMCVHSYSSNSWSLKCKYTLVNSIFDR